MSGRRFVRKYRTDACHEEVREMFRALGATVRDTSNVGNGYPDLNVAFARRTRLVEVKRPGVRGRKRGAVQAATDDKQQSFVDKWGDDVLVLSSGADVVRALQSWDVPPVDLIAEPTSYGVRDGFGRLA